MILYKSDRTGLCPQRAYNIDPRVVTGEGNGSVKLQETAKEKNSGLPANASIYSGAEFQEGEVNSLQLLHSLADVGNGVSGSSSRVCILECTGTPPPPWGL